MKQYFDSKACAHIAATFIAQNVNPQASQQIAFKNITEMLGDVGHTFASLVQCTRVSTAAAHKDMMILKMSYSSISIASKLNEFTNLYENAVKRSANKIMDNDAQDVANFQSQGSYFEHTECYSIVQHKSNANLYLFAIYHNNFDSVYYNAKSGTIMSKEDVAVFLTPSEAKKLFAEGEVKESVSTGISHTVNVRTVSLQNVISLKAVAEQYTV